MRLLVSSHILKITRLIEFINIISRHVHHSAVHCKKSFPLAPVCVITPRNHNSHRILLDPPRATARIYLVSLQDWKFLVRAAVWEIKTLVVVVGMRISIATDSLAGLKVITALLDRGVDIRLVIAG